MENELSLMGSTMGKNGSFLASTISAQCAQPSTGPEDVYVVNVGSNGILTAMLNAASTTFDSVLYARKGDCASIVGEKCTDRTSPMHNLFGGEVISFPVKSGETWYIVVDGYKDVPDGKGDYGLRVSLRTGANKTSPVPVRFELGSPMMLEGAIDSAPNNDVWAVLCGGQGEVIYQVEYGTGVGKLKLSATPGATDIDLALYGTKDVPDGNVSIEGSCAKAGCGETPHLDTFAGTKYLVVDGSLPGGSTCLNAITGPYKLFVEPIALP